MRGLGTVLLGAVVLAGCGGSAESVTPREPVSAVVVTGSDSLFIGQTLQFAATLRDASGNALTGRTIDWQSSSTAIATVSVSGLVTVVDTGTFTITATSEGIAGHQQVIGWALEFAAVSAGDAETCALTSGGRVYCWGLMAGSPAPVRLADSRVFLSVATAEHRACGRVGSGEVLCWSDPRLGATPEPGGPVLAMVSPGPEHTCGLSSTGEAFCWGENGDGRLGNGLIPDSPTPVAVIGGEHYVDLSSGSTHTCAVAVGGTGFCWGGNGNGQLGVTALPGGSREPAPVDGGLSYRTIAAGAITSCGILSDDAVYCWGDNPNGNLGNNSTRFSTVPVAVHGDFKAKAVAPGAFSTCAVDLTDAAWCWGNNDLGNLGTGTTAPDSIPVPVAGGHSFNSISVGGRHACALTTDSVVYCWGANGNGQVGVNGTAPRLEPVKVMGQY